MTVKPTLTADRLRSLVIYEPDSGEFRRRVRTSGKSPAGSKAGSVNQTLGYVIISVDGTQYYAHRLAWLYVYGEWPVQVDHLNGDRADNRIENLRETTHDLNPHNSLVSIGATPHRGVHLHTPGRWRARIHVARKTIHLGLFPSPEEAAAAYLAAKRELHPFWVEQPNP